MFKGEKMRIAWRRIIEKYRTLKIKKKMVKKLPRKEFMFLQDKASNDTRF